MGLISRVSSRTYRDQKEKYKHKIKMPSTNKPSLIAQSPIVTYFKTKRSNRKAKLLAKANIKQEANEKISDENLVKKGPKKVLPKIIKDDEIEPKTEICEGENFKDKENIDPKKGDRLPEKEETVSDQKVLPAGCN